MRRLGEVRLPFDHSDEDLERAVRRLGVGPGERWHVLKRSLDARRKDRIERVYQVGVVEPEDERPPERVRRRPPDPRPVVLGAGPGGLFAAYWLALHGVPPLVLEQGEAMPERVVTMARFMRAGVLDPESNLGFGAGGAGAYSDGKLLTRIRSPHVPFVMRTFVEHGAPEAIRWEANPHLGSNRIRRVIARFIEHLGELGVEVRYRSRVVGLEVRSGRLEGVRLASGGLLPCGQLVLAAGHSARDLYRELERVGAGLEFKPFAVGARLEHPAALVDRIQLGRHAGHPALGAASYRLAETWPEPDGGERGVYSFCMCAGGHLLNAATEVDGVVSNGMSNWGHRGDFSNAAFVATVGEADVPGADPLRGVDWQRAIEVAAAAAANPDGGCWALPGQALEDFLAGRPPRGIASHSCPNPVRPARLDELLPGFVVDAVRRAMEVFARRMRGLVGPEALLVGVETRTSAPVRVPRDPATRQSAGIAGLYPVGEGAGYAGGITSAAVDGIASAEALLETLATV